MCLCHQIPGVGLGIDVGIAIVTGRTTKHRAVGGADVAIRAGYARVRQSAVHRVGADGEEWLMVDRRIGIAIFMTK